MSPTDLFPPSLPGPSKTEAQTGEWNGIEPSPASLGAQPPLPARTGFTSRDDHPGLVPLRPRPDCSGSLSSNTMEPTWSPTPYRCTPASTRRHQRCSQDSDDNSPNELALRPRAGPSTLIAHPKAAIDGQAQQRQHRARLDQRRRSIGPGGRRTTVGDHGARR